MTASLPEPGGEVNPHYQLLVRNTISAANCAVDSCALRRAGRSTRPAFGVNEPLAVAGHRPRGRRTDQNGGADLHGRALFVANHTAGIGNRGCPRSITTRPTKRPSLVAASSQASSAPARSPTITAHDDAQGVEDADYRLGGQPRVGADDDGREATRCAGARRPRHTRRADAARRRSRRRQRPSPDRTLPPGPQTRRVSSSSRALPQSYSQSGAPSRLDRSDASLPTQFTDDVRPARRAGEQCRDSIHVEMCRQQVSHQIQLGIATCRDVHVVGDNEPARGRPLRPLGRAMRAGSRRCRAGRASGSRKPRRAARPGAQRRLRTASNQAASAQRASRP